MSLLDLAQYLLSGGFQFVLTARFTSDCIENLFSCVRTNNPVPTPLELKNKLRLITVSQFLRLKSTTSYDTDDGHMAADFLTTRRSSCSDTESLPVFDDRPLITEAELASLHYLAGYIVF